MISKQLLVGSIVGAVAVTAVSATAGYQMMNSDNYAEVLTVSPVTKTASVPREECRDQLVSVQHPTQDPNQIAGTVAGAVIGGLVGNQIGDGDGKKIATVGGAVAGGISGKKVQQGMQDRNTHQVNQRVCETMMDVTQDHVGYDVKYRLDGQDHTVRMDSDPGRRIRIEDGEPVIE